jgi:hypothetical protein
MCQEVGHTLALDHQDVNQTNRNLGTCMDYTRDPDGLQSNEHPNSHDYGQLTTIYGHTDSFSTTGAVPGGRPGSGGERLAGRLGTAAVRFGQASRRGVDVRARPGRRPVRRHVRHLGLTV